REKRVRPPRPGAMHVHPTRLPDEPALRPHGLSAAGDRLLVVQQDAFGRPVQVLVLAVPERPQERAEAPEPQPQGDGDEVEERAHSAGSSAVATPICGRAAGAGRAPCQPRRTRNAFATTLSDDPDMASAATSGVTCPRMATGRATRL